MTKEQDRIQYSIINLDLSIARTDQEVVLTSARASSVHIDIPENTGASLTVRINSRRAQAIAINGSRRISHLARARISRLYVSNISGTGTAQIFASPEIELDLGGVDPAPTGPIPLGARVFRSTDAFVANEFRSVVTFDSESFDQGDLHDVVVDNSRLTVPAGGAGRWLIQAHAVWQLGSTGKRQVGLEKNGVPIANMTLDASAFDAPLSAGNLTAEGDMAPLVIIDDAAMADFYEMFVYQNQGLAIFLRGGSIQTWFAMARVN